MVLERHKMKIRTHGELNESENTTYQKLWDAKPLLPRKYIALNTYIRTNKKAKKNQLTHYLP